MPLVADGIGFNTPGDVGAGGGLLLGLDPEYQAKQLALKQATAFQNGFPTDANGNPDYAQGAMRLLKLGDYGTRTLSFRPGCSGRAFNSR